MRTLLKISIIAILGIQILAAFISNNPSHHAARTVNELRNLNIEGLPNLYVWTDVSNVYVLRDGESALLIDFGNGSVLEHLPKVGVKNIDWVLFTHHHREQCQGYPLLKNRKTKIAVPAAERALFEHPETFRQMKPSMSNDFRVAGASYVRPPVDPIPVDREFAIMDTFSWHGYEFWCIETSGNSPGGMSYMLKKDGLWYAFSGDVINEGGTMHNWYDSEWDYGFGRGFRALHNSAALLRDFGPTLLLPAHGGIITQPQTALETYLNKLRQMEKLLLRGFEVNTFASSSQDKVSKPSEVPHLWQVSPHIFKLKGPDYTAPNFSLILSDNGHALLVDCGIVDTTFLAETFESLKREYGLKQIDALIITHVHGDHFLQAPYVMNNWNVPVWVLENMVPLMEHPEQFDITALLPAYGQNFSSLPVDRAFKPGESIEWEGFTFTFDWMPGQTRFALCMHGEIDGKLVAFTGDNIFGDPDDPSQDGHEGLISRNDAVLEEGYIYCADFLQRLSPDIMIGGHSYVMDNPSQMIERFKNWAFQMRSAIQSLSMDEDYRYGFDPYLVHAEPYRIRVKRGETVNFNVSVKNYRKREQSHRIGLHTIPGISTFPNLLEGKILADTVGKYKVELKVDEDTPAGISIIAFDVDLDGIKYGQRFDAVLLVD